VSVKCVVQEHNTMSPIRVRTRTELSTLIMRPPPCGWLFAKGNWSHVTFLAADLKPSVCVDRGMGWLVPRS